MKPNEALNIVFGEFMIGKMAVALHMEELREVFPHAGTQPIAAQGPLVVGGLNLRGTMVPVIDLRKLFPSDLTKEAARCVVIIGSKGRLLGLLASEVNCLFGVSAPEIQAISNNDGELPVMQGAVYNAQTDRMVSILSVDKIMALSGVPHAIQNSTVINHGRSTYANASPKSTELPLLLMQSEGIMLAAQPSDIETTIPRAALQKNDNASGYYLGNVLYRGKEIPAVDFLAYLDIPQETVYERTRPKEQAFVIRYAKGCIAFLIDQITDIVRVESTHVMPLPNLGIFKQNTLARVIKQKSIYPTTTENGNFYILNPKGLLNDQRLIDLAALLDECDAQRDKFGVNHTTGANGLSNKHDNLRVIRFDIDTQYAVPLNQIKEVITYDAKQQFLKGRGPLRGIVTHRDQAIPVYDLADCLGKGHEYSEETSNLLLTTVDQQTVAFAVSHLNSIDAARLIARLPLLGDERVMLAQHQVTDQQLIEIIIDQKPTLIQLIDLHALAKRYAQPPAVQDVESICTTACLKVCALGTPENKRCPTSTEGTA